MLPTAMELATSPYAIGYMSPSGLEHVLDRDTALSVEVTTSPFGNDYTPPPGLEHVLEGDTTLSVEVATSPFGNDYTPPPGLEHVLERDATASVDEEGKEEDRCIICMVGPKKFACVPCGHKVTCSDCAEKIKSGGQCIICRQKLENIIEIFG